MDTCCCASLVATPMVDNLYHEGVVVLSLSRLEFRRGAFYFF